MNCPTVGALPPARIATLLARFGAKVSQAAKPLYAAALVDPVEQSNRIDHLLSSLPAGDVRRGQLVFHGEKTACFACHAMGYRGGTVGPDLTSIARIRSPRDLLEAILYPSASFVRSYEPVTILTTDGRSLSGTIQDQTRDHVVLHLSATEQRRVPTSEIEEMLPSKVSVMPAGLDTQLSEQQLADLLEFLCSRK
jgi:putative heme-binding domain-containing protein